MNPFAGLSGLFRSFYIVLTHLIQLKNCNRLVLSTSNIFKPIYHFCFLQYSKCTPESQLLELEAMISKKLASKNAEQNHLQILFQPNHLILKPFNQKPPLYKTFPPSPPPKKKKKTTTQ